LLLALALPRAAGGVLLIDELETALHVSALGKVFRWLLDACKQFNVQLFATTHSLETVDAILSADTTPEEDIVGYRLERTNGHTTAKRYGEDLLKRLRYERGLDVR
jgi:AAA15 family ATPase/GTPase